MFRYFILFALAALACTKTAWGQSLDFEDVMSVQIKKFAPILKNGEVSGYFTFYRPNVKKGGFPTFNLDILDANLNKVAGDKITGTRDLTLDEAVYNGEAMFLKLHDNFKKEVYLYMYNNEGKQIWKKTYKQNMAERVFYLEPERDTRGQTIFDMENIGFVNIVWKKGNGLGEYGYELEFVSSRGAKGWAYESDDKSKDILTAAYLGCDKKNVYFHGMKSRGAFSKDPTFLTFAIDLATGKLVYEAEQTNPNHELSIINGSVDSSGVMTVYGLTYPKGEKILSSKTTGLFSARLGKKGELEDFKTISWAKDLAKYLPVDMKGRIEDMGFPYFHKIFRAANGKIFAVSESYRRKANVAGLLLGAGRSSNAFGVVEDFLVFEFNGQFGLENLYLLDKTPNKIALIAGAEFVSPVVLGYYMKYLDAFDYSFTQLGKDRNRFSVAYHDVDREKKGKDKFRFIVQTMENGKFTKFDFPIKSEATELRILEAKPGYILIVEYFEKEKKFTTRLEKIDY